MGIAAEWISVKGLAKTEVLRRLALSETDETFSLDTDWRTFRLVDAFVAELESGRILVASLNVNVTDAQMAANVSIGAEVVTGSMEEHVDYSEACGYRDGLQVWRIRYNAVRDPDSQSDGIETEGSLPPEFAQAVSQGATEFELPLEVSALVGGYRPDNSLPDTDDVVTIVVLAGMERRPLRVESRKGPGWLRRFFGG